MLLGATYVLSHTFLFFIRLVSLFSAPIFRVFLSALFHSPVFTPPALPYPRFPSLSYLNTFHDISCYPSISSPSCLPFLLFALRLVRGSVLACRLSASFIISNFLHHSSTFFCIECCWQTLPADN